jgi:hypothetical protein
LYQMSLFSSAELLYKATRDGRSQKIGSQIKLI